MHKDTQKLEFELESYYRVIHLVYNCQSTYACLMCYLHNQLLDCQMKWKAILYILNCMFYNFDEDGRFVSEKLINQNHTVKQNLCVCSKAI